jgi:hypothetical protein
MKMMLTVLAGFGVVWLAVLTAAVVVAGLSALKQRFRSWESREHALSGTSNNS